MKKIIYTIGILGVSLFFIQCSSDTKKTAAFKGDPITVQVSKTTLDTDSGMTLASGQLISRHTVNLSTRMMGYISSIPVEVGQSVSRGQQLVTLNSADIDAKSGQVAAQINQAQANYEIAKKDFERFKNLFDSESASQKELDDMTVRYKMAEANLEAAQQMQNEITANKNYTHITAPIAGLITAKFANEGDMANPGMPLLSIESTNDLQARVLLSEKNINQVESGMKVKVLLTALDKEVEGTVAEVSRSAAQTGGQYSVKIDLSRSEKLLPGMFVRVQFPFQTRAAQEGAHFLISKSALVRKGQLQGVYVVSNQNTAVLRWLKLGRTYGEEIEVLSGLALEESYITVADGRLYNGAKVQVQE